MPSEPKHKGGELFIVDNSDADWKVLQYLREWTEIAHTFDIATGFFEIGALLALDSQWQKLDKIRILMGDVVSKRTKKALLEGIEKVLDASVEKEKEANDFLTGVPAIVDALSLSKKKIECRVYTKNKFHAKAYITHAKQAVVGSSALVGSSNFTLPGLKANVELNIQIRREVELLQEWYEKYWDEAEDVTSDILKVIERHVREYAPFDVYAKALQEFFRSHEMTEGEWENARSRMYPVLDQYQKEGYRALLKIAGEHHGAFLCDGVGLGKTFIGLMLIERLIMYERKRVALFVPKAARKPVWEIALRRYLPHLSGTDYNSLAIYNHTDLMRLGEYPERLRRIKELADVFVIDEAHHFRNPGIRGNGSPSGSEAGFIKGEGIHRPSRYRHLYDIAEGKQVFFLTATPVNNKLTDFQHMIELFSRRNDKYFQSTRLGIHSLRGHFIKLERDLKKIIAGEESIEGDVALETNQTEAERVLFNDALFRDLVVQRSRAYVKESQKQHGANNAIFPEKEPPKVVPYSLKKTYGKTLELIEKAFSKETPLFSLAIYYPLAYYKGTEIDAFEENRQKQLVRLIRTQFLKRFESSALAFELSCENLLLKLLSFATKHSETKAEKSHLERWKAQHAEIIEHVKEHQQEFFGDEDDEEADEDIITEEMLENVEKLERTEYKVEEIRAETFLDMNQIVDFLRELMKFKPSHDDKLKALVNLLQSDTVLKKHKVLIFTEYMATAHYLKRELEKAGIEDIDEVDSASKRDRGDIIRQFSPYYNESSSAELATDGKKETRILISTDVLSEGLNLQDATRLINYDLHWNPVRLMQRIGRVDRRLNPEIEGKILSDHPEQKKIRGTVMYWNFLPPKELEDLLRLYSKVTHKTLRISKTFGIEGGKLLKPEDDYDALKDFNHVYEGTTTLLEKMHLEYQKLLKDYPELPERLAALPGRVFSGKQHPSKNAKAVFFCFSLPAPKVEKQPEGAALTLWTEDGETGWYLYDLEKEKIYEEPSQIVGVIRSAPETTRHCVIEKKTLSEIRVKVEKHIKNTYFKKVQAPIGVKATLKAWMELS